MQAYCSIWSNDRHNAQKANNTQNRKINVCKWYISYYDTNMKYLGIDFGERKIGLALSDERGVFAFPHGIISGLDNNKAADHIMRIILLEQINHIVIGKSLRLDGGDNPTLKKAKDFGVKLKKHADAPMKLTVVYQDERFSSVLARTNPGTKKGRPQTRMRDNKRAENKKSDSELGGVQDDAHAAALVLQSYLDSLTG